MASNETTPVSRNAFYLTLAYVIQKILTLGYFVLVARAYGPADQGRYSTALAFASLFAVAVDLGFASMVTREIARNPTKAASYFSQIFLVRLFLGVIVYGLLVVSAHLLGYPEGTLQMIYLTGIAMLMDMLSTACWAVWRGLHNLSYEAQSVVITTLVMVTIGVGGIYLHMPVEFLAIGLLAASATNVMYGYSLLVKRGGISVSWRMDWSLVSALFTLAIPFALAAVCSRIYTFSDVALLSKLAGDEHAGWYSAANKMVLALQFLPAAVSASIFPAMSAAHATSVGVERTFFRAFRYLLLLVAPMAAGIMVLAYPIVATFYGDRYLPSAVLLQVLSFALVFAFLIFPLGALMAAVNRQKANTKILFFAAIINVGGNLLLIPRYGALGAAIVSSATYITIFVIEMVIMYPYWRSLSSEMGLLITRVFFASGVMAVTVWFARDVLPVIVAVGLGAVVYAFLALALKIIALAEVRGVLELIKK